MTSAKMYPLKVVVLQEKEKKTVLIYLIFPRIVCRTVALKRLDMNISNILAYFNRIIMFS
jgi:hypothetical protein